MNKTEFTISTISGLLVAVMMIAELVLSNEAASATGQFEQDQRMISFGRGADHMYQIVAADCSAIKNDPAMTELMLQHDITPQSDIFAQPPNGGVPPLPSPLPSSAGTSTHRHP